MAAISKNISKKFAGLAAKTASSFFDSKTDAQSKTVVFFCLEETYWRMLKAPPVNPRTYTFLVL